MATSLMNPGAVPLARSKVDGAPSVATACSPARCIRRLQERLFAPVDNAWLVMFRVVFGVVMFVEVCRYFANGWVHSHFDPARFHFTYYGFEWVKPLPSPLMEVHFAVLGLAALCIAAGFCYRLAAAVFFAGFSYIFLIDEVYYLNHFYLICQVGLLMIFLPAAGRGSVETWLHPEMRAESAPAWTLWLMRAQIGIPYFFGGIAKLNSDWLHGEPMRMWLARRADFPVIGQFFREEWSVCFFVLGGLLLDLCIVPLLLWRRTRVLACCGAAAFHLLNSQLFQIGIFPWLMLAATLIYLPPDSATRMLAKLGWTRRDEGDATAGRFREPGATPARKRHVVLGLLAVYVVCQVLMPLRHFAYPGNVSWTEEGHRFAWHMKLRSKSGEVLFHVRDPQRHEAWTVDPRKYFHPSICKDMATHPDMLLQYSHELAGDYRRAGREVEVRASALVSLNGRRPQFLVNPEVDLTKVERSLAPAGWILPLTEPLRPSGGTGAMPTDD